MLRDLRGNGLCGGARVGRAGNRASDDQIMRTGANRIGRGDDSGLIVRRGAGRPNPRRDDDEVAQTLMQRARFLAGGHDAIKAGILCKPRPFLNQRQRRHFDTLLRQIGAVEIGEDGHAKELERAVATAAHRRVQRLAVRCMDREEMRARHGDGRGGPFDRRFDIEKLCVKEYAVPLVREFLGEGQSAPIDQFETDLVDADAAAQFCDEAARFIEIRDVECHDDPLVRRQRLRAHVRSPYSLLSGKFPRGHGQSLDHAGKHFLAGVVGETAVLGEGLHRAR